MNARVQFGLLITLSWLVGARLVCAQGPPPDVHRVQQTGWHVFQQAQQPTSEYDQMMYELVPTHRDSLHDLGYRLHLGQLEEALSGSWMRLEYLQGSIHDGGQTLGRNYRDPFGNLIRTNQQYDLVLPADDAVFPTTFPTNLDPATDPVTGEFLTIPVEAPNAAFDLSDINGLRGSFGIPVTDKSFFEASFWGLEDVHDVIDTEPLPPSSELGAFGLRRTRAYAITLTTDGQLAPQDADGFVRNRVILYDESFFSHFKADLWSADANYVLDLRHASDGWLLQSILGYKHTEYGEEFIFGGGFNNSTGSFGALGVFDPDVSYLDVSDGDITTQAVGVLATPVTNRVESHARNFRNELQFGLRSEWQTKWFDVGVAPKVGLGASLVRQKVTTSNVREPGDLGLAVGTPLDDPALTIERDREILFSPSFDLGLYANVHVNEWMNLRVGYNFVWLGNVASAVSSIRYNEITTDPLTGATDPDVGLTRRERDIKVNLFTVGGEILLP